MSASISSEPTERFTGQDRFAAVVAFGVLSRNEGRSVPEAHHLAEHWNQDACDPPLDEIIRRHAVDIAYFQPELADRIVSEPACAKPEHPWHPSFAVQPQPSDNAQGPEVEASVVIRPKKDRTAAERQRRYRERRKQAAVTRNTVTDEDAATVEGTVTVEGAVTPNTVMPGGTPGIITDATVTAKEVAHDH